MLQQSLSVCPPPNIRLPFSHPTPPHRTLPYPTLRGVAVGEQDMGVAQAVAAELLPFHDRGDWDGALQVRRAIVVYVQPEVLRYVKR